MKLKYERQCDRVGHKFSWERKCTGLLITTFPIIPFKCIHHVLFSNSSSILNLDSGIFFPSMRHRLSSPTIYHKQCWPQIAPVYRIQCVLFEARFMFEGNICLLRDSKRKTRVEGLNEWQR